MRLTVRMRPKNNHLVIPLNYQSLLQGIIYQSLKDDKFASFLHEYGFIKGKRSYKLFTFSRLYGKHTLNLLTKSIVFEKQITWYISTALPELAQQLGENFILQHEIQLWNQSLYIESIELDDVKVTSSSIEIDMLSPLTVYRTHKTMDGKQKTYFLQPYDHDFGILIETNFRNKYEAYFHEKPTERLIIEPVNVEQHHKVVTMFKNYYITGWCGKYRLKSNPKYLTFLLNTGIGGKNSQGFGMFRVVRNLPISTL